MLRSVPVRDRRERGRFVLRAMTRRYVFGMLLYIAAFALAFVSPAACLALIVILALLFVLPEPDGSRTARRTNRSAKE